MEIESIQSSFNMMLGQRFSDCGVQPPKGVGSAQPGNDQRTMSNAALLHGLQGVFLKAPSDQESTLSGYEVETNTSGGDLRKKIAIKKWKAPSRI
ncbi:hypothetical protein TNCV_4970251 [Trichonephila clavipes]|nr:hypothetical protein TNCV_4970251 [Trichonephila clavipes]